MAVGIQVMDAFMAAGLEEVFFINFFLNNFKSFLAIIISLALWVDPLDDFYGHLIRDTNGQEKID